MKKIVLTLISLFIALSVFSQNTDGRRYFKSGKYVNTPNYELAARFSQKNIYKMVHSTHIEPKWFQNSNKFWYEWKTSEGTKYYIVDPVKASKKEVFDMPRLAMQITEITKDPYDAKHIPFMSLKLKDDKYFTFTIMGTQNRVFPKDTTKDGKKKPSFGSRQNFYFQYNIETGELENVTEIEQDKEPNYPSFAVISPDGTKGVYVKNYNLYMMDSTNLRKAARDDKDSTIVEIQLTKDGTKDFSWGSDNYKGDWQTDSSYRYTPTDLVWSPDSKKFAKIRWDMSKVKDFWVIDALSSPRPVLETYKYQMPGEAGPTGHLYVYDVNSNKLKHIRTAEFKDQDLSFEYAEKQKKDMYKEYIRSVDVWKGDANGFYMLRRSRDLKRLDLCYVPVNADSVNVIVKERLNTYVEDRPIWMLKNGKQFVQWSERNGWANLYLYNSDGTLVRNLTDGPYHVQTVIGANEKENYIVFMACGVNNDENPYQMHTYKVSLNGGPIQQLDMPDMDVSSYSSEDGKYFVANYSRVDYKPAVALYNASTGKKVMELEEADFSQLFAAGYKFPERFTVKAADGITNLYGAMYKPFDFDSTKVYPICDYVYPGPQVEAYNISWSAGMTRTDRLAQLGFIVITVGNRGGHPNRSKWYHNYGYGNLRDYGLQDQKYAIQQLAARYSFIDINRVGIHGHSGGGFMSTAAILKYPDFFKAAVSCAGNHDNRIYNRWWSEQHHGIKEKIMEGDTTFVYNISTNQELAKNLKGHLLLVHGDQDDNVNPANTIRVVDALIRANKRFDMLILPGQRHGFGDMNEYFFWKMADYYSEWLMGRSERGEVDIKELNND